MKPDLYAKTVLTVIALAFVMIACNQLVNPATAAQAQGPFAGVQFSGGTWSFVLFDSRTGDIWQYSRVGGIGAEGKVEHTKISAPGVPASAVQWAPR